MFINFTKKYLNYFVKNKYNLDNNNKLILLLNDEKRKIYYFIKNTNINIEYDYNYIDTDNNIFKHIDSYFVESSMVYDKIDNLNKTILIKWNNSKIIIKTNINNINILMLKLNVLIYIIEFLGNNKNLNIILILTDLEKYTPHQNEIIGVKHINSGYSYDNNIVVWRYEEFEKVLLHEICHVIKLDKRNHKTDIIIDTTFHNYFEAICDFYAICYHIVYLSLITDIKPKIFLELELGFIKNQAMKIYNFFNLKVEIFDSKIKIIQDTSAFSYYIIKYLLFDYIVKLKLDNLLEYINTINYSILLNNIMTTKFINSNYHDIKSLRMTLFQLKN